MTHFPTDAVFPEKMKLARSNSSKVTWEMENTQRSWINYKMTQKNK